MPYLGVRTCKSLNTRVGGSIMRKVNISTHLIIIVVYLNTDDTFINASWPSTVEQYYLNIILPILFIG